MKRSVKVSANDGDVLVEIKTRIITTRQAALSRDEVDRIATKVGRVIADGVRVLPYTDFGPENTIVR